MCFVIRVFLVSFLCAIQWKYGIMNGLIGDLYNYFISDKMGLFFERLYFIQNNLRNLYISPFLQILLSNISILEANFLRKSKFKYIIPVVLPARLLEYGMDPNNGIYNALSWLYSPKSLLIH